uniref:KRR-R motif-containing protein 1 n=1 Tax=Ditylenchus dipsaci TaxID=166011 RepID=A0A915EMI7_9BILA
MGSKEEDVATTSKKMELPPGKDPKWWNISTFNQEDNPTGLRKYIREVWPLLKKSFADHHLKCDLDVLEGTMTVRTSRKTFDPFILFKARDVIKLIARSVPYEHAIRVLDDDVFCDLVRMALPLRQ